MSFKCRIKIQRKRIEFRKGRLFAVMKKKNKKKTEFFPRRRRYIFHLRDSIRYFLLSLLPLSPSPPPLPSSHGKRNSWRPLNRREPSKMRTTNRFISSYISGLRKSEVEISGNIYGLTYDTSSDKTGWIVLF